jgi:hypothetical protein
MRFLNFLIIFSLSVIITHNVQAQIMIQKNENFKNEKISSNKIIFINPEYTSLVITDDTREDFDNELEIKLQLNQKIKLYSAKVKLIVEVISDPEYGKEELAYFNELIPLKNEILKANSTQNNPLDINAYKTYEEKFSQNIFVQSVKISPEFSNLSKKIRHAIFCIDGLDKY